MKYTGTCHCKKVKYEVTTTLTTIISCNCSHCQIKGLLLTFVPAKDFHLISGKEVLTTYHFNKKVIEHLFCKECGVQAFSYGKDKEGHDTVAVNIRSLHGIDIEKVHLTPIDGKSW